MSWISETEILENREDINGSLLPLSNNLMLQVLGNPRGNYSQQCQPVTNSKIRKLIVTEDVGPFRVTGLSPAVEALADIFRDIRAQHGDIYDALGSAGMLCCRFVRNSTSSISNHSWGCAIDLTLEGKLDFRGDKRVQKGLKAIHPIFNAHKFYWGAAFRTEDAMHFEASRQLLMEWQKAGKLGDNAGQKMTADPETLDVGDRGPAVERLQKMLNIVMGVDLHEDGVFGVATRAALIAFQIHQGVTPTGLATTALLKLLGAAKIV
jgi:hypothetical protein